ncbi:hypothetical protein KJ836_00795 [Patescibacteria group bacterium]|nr:hypothetical protein [Patescibacteria group bacterium]
MNTKTIYTILAVVVIAILGYYFINNQTPTNQLPINNNTDEPTTTEPIQNEPGDTKTKDIENKIEESKQTPDLEHTTYTDAEIGISVQIADGLFDRPFESAPRRFMSTLCGGGNDYNVIYTEFVDKEMANRDIYYSMAISLYDTDFSLDNIGDVGSCNLPIQGTYHIDDRTAYRIHTEDPDIGLGMAAYVFELPGKDNKHLRISFGGVAPINGFWTESKINQVLNSIDILA